MFLERLVRPRTRPPIRDLLDVAFRGGSHDPPMAFLTLLLIGAGNVVLRRRERGRLAFGLLVASAVLTASLFRDEHLRARTPARNVVIVTIDGLRWQEVFGGAASEYFKKDSKGQPGDAEKQFMRATPDERRAVVMPFMWNVVAKQGQIFGDPAKQSLSHVTNDLWFSYPGYNEMFSGAADPRVDSNDKVPNPNVTVLEWLNSRKGFVGRVAAFGAWDVLPFILNTPRSHLPVGSGFSPVTEPTTARQREINELARDLPAFWSYGPVDAPIVYAALDHLRTRQPRVLYIMLGEGDEWAHQGRYDLYLDATVRADRFIERIWNTLQSAPAYTGNTTLLLTTDHGRGATTSDWTDHGREVPAAERTWMAAIGPDIPPLGVREHVTVTTAQLAATIAAVVGEDFRAAAPNAAPPLPLIPSNGR
jgi:phosphopentomutase/2,3-bisphosphoglycerate-independent phosphoglycerate mutase family metalloenzyme